MSRDNHSIDSLATFLSLCQTTVRRDEDEETKNTLAIKAKDIAEVLKLDLSCSSQLILDGRHPLVEACRAGNIKIVEMFVKGGASLNFVDPDGRSPLYAAIVGRNCSSQDIQQLLHWGANVNLHRDGKLPLFASLYCMGTEVSRLLISEGADVNNVVLTCFCFIESVFALNTTLIMVMSGFQLRQFNDLPAMFSLALEIVLAGLLPKTFYLSSGRRLSSGGGRRHPIEEEGLMSAELAMLWRLQHLCLCLGFRVDRACVESAVAELKQQLQEEEFTVPSDEDLIALADASVAGVSNFFRRYQLFPLSVGIQGQGRREEHESFRLRNESTEREPMDSIIRDQETALQQRVVMGDLAEHSSNPGSNPEPGHFEVLKNKLSQLLWIQHFQVSPMPLTYLARMSIRAHLSQPSISKGKHIEKAISVLPIPRMFRDFLALQDYRKGADAFL